MRIAIIGCIVASTGLALLAAELWDSQRPAALTAPAKSGQTRTETKHLTVTTSASAASVAPGGRLELFVDIAPKPKMHVYAPEQKEYIPVSFTVETSDSIKSGAVRFPKAETYFFAPLKETQLVYSKPFRMFRDVTVAPTAAGAEVTIKGTIRYQACDDTICYVPQNVPVSWTIGIKR
jgi:DsbC/DsbD-like thiol-disulfide interchange protein